MIFDKLASAIKNDVMSGLQGLRGNISMSIDQLKDDIVDERLQIIKEYSLKGILPKHDLMLSINCIPTDCKDLSSCSKCFNSLNNIPTAHFELPQILLDFTGGIEYIGTTDRQFPFRWSIYNNVYSTTNKYRKRNKDVPFVLIYPTPNENGMFDCFIFNAPLIKNVSVTAIFKDPRQLQNYGCCIDDDNFSFINNEIKKRLTIKKIQYYRQYSMENKPNNQQYS